MKKKSCYHCGSLCDSLIVKSHEKYFCCNGCKTVFEIFSENNMTCYYDFQDNPGAIPIEIQGKFDYLSNESILTKLLDFNDNDRQIVSLYIPHIHCSSCIWVLENLHKLRQEIISSQVNFSKKKVRITFNSYKISLKEVVILLSSIGYEPYISLEDSDVKKNTLEKSLIYKLGIAGFAFGNIMFLSFPEYFEVSEFWLEKYKYIFRWLMFAFSLPVVFYSANDYFISAYKGLKSKILNIDIPIALGISVLFLRSFFEVLLDIGAGFFDSLSGLVFFLLLGKFFQQKTYNFLSFERDYKSYFPIAITKILNNSEENIEIYDVVKGDRLLIRNQEIIPSDGILISPKAQIDYSFVTGESKPIFKKSGDKIFAGGKQISGVIEMEVLNSISQSYLTQLWSNDVFSENNKSSFTSLTDNISKYFTLTILSIAVGASLFWVFYEPSKILNVFTSVLIIACPCAIALAAPFTLGNMLRIFGRHKFYVKNAQIIEKLGLITTTIFDKTGTITSHKNNKVCYDGSELTSLQKTKLRSILRASNHTLSRRIYNELEEDNIISISNFKEFVGKGIEANVGDDFIRVGSESFVKLKDLQTNFDTTVHISFNNKYSGKFTFRNKYRKGFKTVFKKLSKDYMLGILSGDNSGEYQYLKKNLPIKTNLLFQQKPEDKLYYIKKLQSKDQNVLMVGDGLNDSGALAQSNVGIALSEDINVFSPACDAILDAEKFQYIPVFIQLAKKSIKIIHYAFILSLFYNIIGLYFAVTGQLSPIIAAILMPLSSISIVVFTTLATNFISNKIITNEVK